MSCTGEGDCINYGAPCDNLCVKCPNFDICGSIKSQYILDAGNGQCIECDMYYGQWSGGDGNLQFIEDLDSCPVCYKETVRGVKLPRCIHKLCLECFKEMYTKNSKSTKPICPIEMYKYEEYEDYRIYLEDTDLYIENLLDNGFTEEEIEIEIPSRPSWLTNSIEEDIITYNKAIEEWNNKISNRYLQDGDNLLLCPLCRAPVYGRIDLIKSIPDFVF